MLRIGQVGLPRSIRFGLSRKLSSVAARRARISARGDRRRRRRGCVRCRSSLLRSPERWPGSASLSDEAGPWRTNRAVPVAGLTLTFAPRYSFLESVYTGLRGRRSAGGRLCGGAEDVGECGKQDQLRNFSHHDSPEFFSITLPSPAGRRPCRASRAPTGSLRVRRLSAHATPVSGGSQEFHVDRKGCPTSTLRRISRRLYISCNAARRRRRHSRRAVHHAEEKRHADQRGQRTDRQLPRRDDRAGEEVGDDEERAAARARPPGSRPGARSRPRAGRGAESRGRRSRCCRQS